MAKTNYKQHLLPSALKQQLQIFYWQTWIFIM